jgi:hypothetical protein
MTKISEKAFTDALVRAGIISANDLSRIRRIVIDVRPMQPVYIHIQYIGEDNLLGVLPLFADSESEGTMNDG